MVLFLGDYVDADAVDRGVRAPPAYLAVEADSLERYRMRYALYKLDPDLQAAHHSAPWIVTWDDHEVANDHGRGSIPTARRAAAYQAFWEHQPVRVPPPWAVAMTLHRRFAFGSLAALHILDTRQHRAVNVAGEHWQRDSPSRRDPRRSVLGPEQEAWLSHGLRRSTATWNLLGQQVIAGRLDLDPTDGQLFNVDAWDGYPVAQRRLHAELARARNPVVLTGDVHAGTPSTSCGIRCPSRWSSPRTSISSGGDGASILPTGVTLLAANGDPKYVNQRRRRAVPADTGGADGGLPDRPVRQPAGGAHRDRSLVLRPDRNPPPRLTSSSGCDRWRDLVYGGRRPTYHRGWPPP